MAEQRPSIVLRLTVELPPEYTGNEPETVEIVRTIPMLVIQHGQLAPRITVRVKLVSAMDELLDDLPLPYWIEPW